MSNLPPIQLLDTVASTNDIALQAVHQSAAHGSCWVADQQTKGRGRRRKGARRQWHSPPGCNLYFSLILRPNLPPAKASRLTLAVAVALQATLAAATHLPLMIKWPNDLLLHGKKVAGILTEGVFDGPKFAGAVVGIGVNVNTPPQGFPPELSTIATSLASHTSNTHWDRLSLALDLRRSILAHLELFTQEGLPAILEKWRPLDASLGRQVEVQGRQGSSLGISDNGALLVEFAPGDVLEVESGEVLFLPNKSHG